MFALMTDHPRLDPLEKPSHVLFCRTTFIVPSPCIGARLTLSEIPSGTTRLKAPKAPPTGGEGAAARGAGLRDGRGSLHGLRRGCRGGSENVGALRRRASSSGPLSGSRGTSTSSGISASPRNQVGAGAKVGGAAITIGARRCLMSMRRKFSTSHPSASAWSFAPNRHLGRHPAGRR
jgi:hypothetical protein